ncbi:MAG: rod shape-determining protein MreC [Flammeovirgaceae bacterium]|nr:rod shape-determining protein MreC [Flammeovirgaceae bacterium]
MRNLLKFISRYNYSITFFLLFSISILLISNESFILRSEYFNSSNYISGSFYKAQNNIFSYFSLGQKNEKLENENLTLINKLSQLESKIKNESSADRLGLNFIKAQVINNSLNKSKNYITIDKGLSHGIKKNLGVISTNGVIGKIKHVSDNFSTIISVLNTSFFLSTVIKETKTLSSLNWDGEDPKRAKLLYVPKHIPLEVGFSVLTSSFDSIFPQDIKVGRITSINKNVNSNFYDIEIILSEDFYSISNVYVVMDSLNEEKVKLEMLD